MPDIYPDSPDPSRVHVDDLRGGRRFWLLRQDAYELGKRIDQFASRCEHTEKERLRTLALVCYKVASCLESGAKSDV
jgi:hypothetical protein